MSNYGTPPPAPPPPPPFGSMPPGQPSMGSPPPNYLVWSILTTIFCCLPLGIVSIVFAAQVNSKWAAGDVAGAQDSSAKARRWAIWGAVIGVILNVIGIIFALIAGAAGMNNT
jgi:hypothetical protein